MAAKAAQLAQRLKELQDKVNADGNIKYDDILLFTKEKSLTSKQLDSVFKALHEGGVEIIYEEDGKDEFRDGESEEEFEDELLEDGDAEADVDEKEWEKGDGDISADPAGITDPVRLYLRECGTTPLLTSEQEMKLAQTIEIGKMPEATDEQKRMAAEAKKEMATWWIRQAITRSIADQARTIRVPVHMVETINKMNRVGRHFLQEHGREATNEELAKEMETSVEKIREAKKAAQDPISLETPIGEKEDSHLGDFIEDQKTASPEDEAAATMRREQIHQLLETLTEREKGVIALRYGIDDGTQRTLEEVGKYFGVTRERIRQIEGKALKKLKKLAIPMAGL